MTIITKLWFKKEWTQVHFIKEIHKPWDLLGNGGDICPKEIQEKYGTENVFLIRNSDKPSKDGWIEVTFANLSMEGECMFQYWILESLLEPHSTTD